MEEPSLSGVNPVILLTKLDGSFVLLNLDTVKYVENKGDTLIFFVNGDTLIVRESLEEVERRVLDLKRKILEKVGD
jgi:uncharacterized protein YlzI (FlbEa/FlbD family)